MKSKYTILLSLLLYLCFSLGFSQDHTSFEISNISYETARDAVNKTLSDLKLGGHLWNNQTVTESNFYYYTVLMVKNRLKLRVSTVDNKISVSIFGRQYKSSSSWINNPAPMSKKQAAKILNPIRDKLIELTNTESLNSSENLITDKKNHSNKKAGIYDDFVIIRTKDKDMDLLAMHKNGNIIGFDLCDDMTTVKSLVFKESQNGESVTVLFDEEGIASTMLTENHIIKLKKLSDGLTELNVKDLQGNDIGIKNVTFNTSIKPNNQLVKEIKKHGPSSPILIYLINDDMLSLNLANASTVTKSLVCVGGVLSAASGVGAVIAGVACSSAFFDIIARVLPENHPKYNQMYWASEITGLVSPKGLPPWIKGLADITGELNKLKNFVDEALEYKNNYWPETTYNIEGFDTILSGSFGEWGKEPVVYRVEIKESNSDIKWESSSEDLHIEVIEMGNKDYKPNYSSVKVFARESSINNHNLIATIITNGNKISEKKKITIITPNYFYMPYPDGSRLQELGLISNAEAWEYDTQAEKCKKKIWNENGNILENNPDIISAILQEHLLNNSDLTDNSMSIDSRKLNFVRKIWKPDGSPYPSEEIGEFRDFVKPAPCMAKWFGFQDKQTIIILAHEGMDYIKKANERIEMLQKQITQNNMNQIASDINKEEKYIKRIRKEYGAKINAIAEKGTIQFPIIKISDPFKSCYKISDIRIKGAHWENKSLTILLDYGYKKQSCKVKTKYNATYEGEGVKTLTYKFIDENDKVVKEAATTITSSATITMNITDFEQTSIIEFFRSRF